jgi:hypothetical protein
MRIRDGEALSASQVVAEKVAEAIANRMSAHNRTGARADMRATPPHRAYTPTPAPPPSRGRGSPRGDD